MAVTFGKTEVQKMIAVLEEDHETVEDAAKAALAAAADLYESRAKFVVVGQSFRDPEPIAGEKVSLGMYSTAGTAQAAAEGLGTAGFRHWVLPVHHGTPSALAKERANARKAAAEVEPRMEWERRMAEWRQACIERAAELAVTYGVGPVRMTPEGLKLIDMSQGEL